MLFYVAVLHAIGEDNEPPPLFVAGAASLVAKTREELDAKVLAFANEWFDDPFLDDACTIPRTEPVFASLDALRDVLAWSVDEHTLD